MWQKELLAVATLLVAVALATGGQPVGWVGVAAVVLTFCFTQVGTRLSEAEDRRAQLEREVRSLSQRYEHAADRPPIEAVEAAEKRLEHHRLIAAILTGKSTILATYGGLVSALEWLQGLRSDPYEHA